MTGDFEAFLESKLEVKMYKSEIETASRDELQDIQLRLLQNQLRYVYTHSPMYRRKYDEADLQPEDIKTPDDIAKIPFTTKEELRESQAGSPPYGDILCVSPDEGVFVFKTSGTTGRAVKIIYTPKDWFDVTCEQVAYAAYAYGLERSDVAFLAFGYSTFVAFWVWHAGLGRLGVTVVPGGGQSSKERIRNILDWQATFVCGTPTYIVHLGNVAKEMGVDLASQSQVRIVALGGEPGAQIPSTRKLIEEVWGAKCYDVMGAAEMPSTFGFECIYQRGLHINERHFYLEVIDKDTDSPVGPGQLGEMVMSNLTMETMPLIRYRMRDMVKVNYDKCECGRTFARLEGGVLGRVDDMITFAGVNIYPSAIENLVRGERRLSTEFQIIVPKMGTGKRLRIKVEPGYDGIDENQLKEAAKNLTESIKWQVGITPEVEIVPLDSLPRFEVKAQRIISEK
jgi:phenylacetate-CoA ligase